MRPSRARPSRAARRRATRASRSRSPRRPRASPGARRDVVVRRRDALEPAADDLAQLALDPVAHERVPDRLRHGEPEPGLADGLVALEPVERQEPRRDRPALAVDGVEVAGARKTIPALQRTYAERRLRPLARRRFRIMRPARVDMRLRKPCFFAPLAYVRLIGPFHESRGGGLATSDPAAGEYSRTIPGDSLSTGSAHGKSRGKRDTAIGRRDTVSTAVESRVERGEKPCKSRTLAGLDRPRNPH